MSGQSGNGRQALIDQLRAYLQDRVPEVQAELVAKFAQRYYASAPLDDLFEHSIEDLFGALISHWSLIYQRKPGETKVKVFNPTLKDDGWQSRHTIIEVSIASAWSSTVKRYKYI
jgi:glutamate dehydrogenase